MNMPSSPLRVFIDGACPICRVEGAFLHQLDRGRGRVIIEDIAAPDFDAGRFGLTLEEVMSQIHALRPDGRILRGMEVFRQAYAALGLGWLAAPTGWPMARPLFDHAYNWFARNRLRITGRLLSCRGSCRLHRPPA